jgi:hypothetical protein
LAGAAAPGKGKTTELRQLAGVLASDGYYPVQLSGVRELNLEQLTVIELLMSFLWVVQDAQVQQNGRERRGTQASPGQADPAFTIEVPSRADQELNLALASVLVEDRDRASAELKLQTEFGAEAGLPFFVKVKAALKSMMSASTERARTVRAEIIPRFSTPHRPT